MVQDAKIQSIYQKVKLHWSCEVFENVHFNPKNEHFLQGGQ
jgi:hypothetical protein